MFPKTMSSGTGLAPRPGRLDYRHMPRLHSSQLRRLFDGVYEMNTARDHADFATAVLAAMSRMIPADVCHLHVMNRTTGKLLQHAAPDNPFTPKEVAYYRSHSHENLLVNYYARTHDTRARRLSDVAELVEYRRSEYYHRCHRRLGFVYHLALPITVEKHTVAGLVFSRRRRDFTKTHCALLDAFAPHFLLAWSRHQNPWHEPAQRTPSARERLRRLGLTPREADVLFWMTEGKQNREIATILSRSLETVQEHVGNLLRKLGQENRHAATVFALRELRGRA
jgi:DNA-binding CsgD family transcriptional regulator